jgi:trimeric autotransporter adhesin
MKTIAYAIALFAVICLPVKARSQQHKPLFKTTKELSQPYQKKQMPPNLFQLRQDIITGNKKINEHTLQELFKSAGNNVFPHNVFNGNSNARESPGNGNAGLASSVFHLTRDIDNATSSSPSNTSFTNYFDQHFAVINNVSYFWADDGVHGNDLWRSDGTVNGTYMVKDIIPGESSAGGSDIVAVNNKIYFRGPGVADLWSSDGTDAGTQLVATIPNTGGNSIFFFFAAGNYLYFIASTPGSIFNQLWKSDGTSAGTVIVYDAGSFNPGWGITHMAYANGILYFTNSDYDHGYELWRTNGTTGGTYLVQDVDPSNTNYYDEGPDYLTTYNNLLYFTQFDGISRKLWVADALGNGATLVPGNVIFNSTNFYLFTNVPFPVSNNYMYFYGYTATAGNELYKFDAVNGESIVKDITPGTAGTTIPVNGLMADVNNTLFFGIINSNNQHELWATKGKNTSTQRIRQFNAGESFYNLFNAYGTLFFQAYNQSSGNELWRSNGTEAGTVLLKDIYPGALSGNPTIFTTCNNRVLFSAYGSPTGYELWATDGTTTNTRQLKDINKTTTTGSYAGAYYGAVAPTTNGILFLANQKNYGSELYQSDGTAGGTNMVRDIYPGESGSFPRNLVQKNGYTYFSAQGPADSNVIRNNIYRTDGTAAGTIKIASADVNNTVAVTDNGLVYYVVYNPQTFTSELWRSNGLPAGTFILASGFSSDVYPVAAGNTVFFSNGNSETGYELWKSNGTVAGTQMVKDINPGVNSSSPYSLFAFNGFIFFGASDGNTTSLWRSNGIAGGTIKLQEVTPVNTYNTYDKDNYFCISNDVLYFVGSDALSGTEVWRTTGTPASTKILKDVFDGSLSSNPYYLRDVNGALYFQALDNTYNYGIWSANGTPAGTNLITYIPGFINYPTVAAGKYYFVLNDLLYVCGGTAASTSAVDDAGLAGLHNLQGLQGSGNKLFFNAYSYKYGPELYEGDLGSGIFTAISNEKVVTSALKFDAKIFPNPVKNIAQLTVSGDIKNLTVSVTDMNGKIAWRQAYNSITQINLSVENFAAGTYFVSVSNGKETKVIKLLKQ